MELSTIVFFLSNVYRLCFLFFNFEVCLSICRELQHNEFDNFSIVTESEVFQFEKTI